MKILLISLILGGIASAQVPSLINYQGRLTNAEGEPLSGTKKFELNIFDAQTGGNLLYTENVGAIQLAEGGVYSFQFGGKGTSNTQTTETVGTGNGENLYQRILSNTPVVEGSVSVSDGTYTWSQESGSSNEDDFSSSFSKNLSRITVNYFADAPNDNRDIKVTYRYEAEGILGALSSSSEHWLQLSIDGETQAARERVLAVPFALRAGIANKINGADKILTRFYPNGQQLSGPDKISILNQEVNVIRRIKTRSWDIINGEFRVYRISKTQEGPPEINSNLLEDPDFAEIIFSMKILPSIVGKVADSGEIELLLDHEKNYYGFLIKSNQGASWYTPKATEIFYTR